MNINIKNYAAEDESQYTDIVEEFRKRREKGEYPSIIVSNRITRVALVNIHNLTIEEAKYIFSCDEFVLEGMGKYVSTVLIHDTENVLKRLLKIKMGTSDTTVGLCTVNLNPLAIADEAKYNIIPKVEYSNDNK